MYKINFISIFLITLSAISTFNAEDVLNNNKLSYEVQLENLLALTADFFTGLYDFKQFKNPDLEINSTTFEAIDNIIDHYIHIIKKAHGLLTAEEILKQEKPKLHRRNAPTYVENKYKTKDELALKGFEELNIVPAQIPIDIILFEKPFSSNALHFVQYAASLEINNYQNQSELSVADTLVLYKYMDGNFIKVFSIPVSKATKILSKTIDENVYIIVTSVDDELHEKTSWRGSILYQVDMWKDALVPVQMLGTWPAYDVAFWDDHDHTYMALAIGGQKSGETKSIVYRWLGGHFDIIDQLPAVDARKIIEFAIGSDRFIIIADHKNEQGITATYSPIYRYDIHEERFVIYQYLSTHAAVDVKYFNIVDHEAAYDEEDEQHFLLVANQYEIDMNGKKDFTTTSTLYKFSENYFVPFQGFDLYSATEWLPFKDPYGKPFLLVNCFYEGLRAFNYDGWKFVEAPLEFGGDALGRGIASLRLQSFLGQPVLVIANPGDASSSLPNIFRPIFKQTTSIATEKANMLTWCQNRLAEITTFNAPQILDQMISAPKLTDPVVFVPGTIDFANEVHIANLSTDAIWTDNYLIDDTVIRNINNLQGDLNHHMGFIDALLNKSETLIRTDMPVKIRGSLSAPRIMATATKLDQIETNFLNNQDFDVIRHKVLQNQLSDVLEFEKLTIDTTLEFRQINGRPVDTLLFKNRDHYFETLVVDNILIQKNLVTGFVNNATFDSSILILNNTDQYFDFLDVNNLKSNSVNSATLNNVDVNQKPGTSYYNSDGDLNIPDLKTGTLNGINVAMLYENTLKKYGDQEVIADYEIPELHASDFIGPELANVRPENVIDIKRGSYILDQDIALKKQLQVEDLRIINRLNNILVENGELQVILKDSDKPQKVLGKKVFESVELLEPMNLQGMINSSALDRMNPVTNIAENLILEGDFVLDNIVTIRRDLKADNIISVFPNSNDIQYGLPVSNLLQYGLPLDSSDISIPFEFTQPFKAFNLNVEFINQVPVESWVCSSEEPTIIYGRKIFSSTLQISGSSNFVGTINGINVPEMLTNTLRINSNHVQKVDGRVVLENVNSERLTSEMMKLNNKSLHQYLTRSTHQHLSQGIVFIGGKKCSVGHIDIQNIKILNQTQNYETNINTNNLKEIMNFIISDCMTNSDSRHITGAKTFRNIIIGQLDVATDGLNVPEHKKRQIRQTTLHTGNYEGPVHIRNSLVIKKLNYTGTLDGVSHLDFGSQWLLADGDQIISAPLTITEVSSEAPINLDGQLNGIKMSDLDESVLYTNRDYELPSVNFENGFRAFANLQINDKICDLYFPDSLILKNDENLQHVTGTKRFDNLSILGKTTLSNGYLGTLNIDNFCTFIDPAVNGEFDLKVLGSANFISDVDINNLNGYNLDKLLTEAWFSNIDTVITGNKKFGDAEFRSQVIVNGLVNNIDLNRLEENYFSLSKDQTISGSINFQKESTFLSNVVVTSSVEVAGSLNDIQNLNEFVYESLDKYSEQVLDGKFIFDQLTIRGDLHGIINKIDFEHDVVRYNSTNNYVIGNKIFETVYIKSLLFRKDVQISGIDINKWFQNSVASYSNTDFFILEAPVTIANGGNFPEGIATNGLVNGYPFTKDTILLRHSDQTITGVKEFFVNDDVYVVDLLYNPILQINNLRIALLEAFLNDLVVLNSDDDGYSSIEYLGRNLKFAEQLNVKELNGNIIKSAALMYGVDLVGVQHDIDNFSKSLNYHDMDQEFMYLDYLSDLLKYNIDSQAQFLHHYEVIQQIDGDVVYNNNSYNEYNIKSEIINVYKNSRMQTMSWNAEKMKFEYQIEPSPELEQISPDIAIYDPTKIDHFQNIIHVTIESKECLIILNAQSQLKCKMDYSLDFVVVDTYFTAGAMTVNVVKSDIGTLLVFLVQQKSKQGLPTGSVIVYLINNLGEEKPSKLLQILHPTRPTSISLIANPKQTRSDYLGLETSTIASLDKSNNHINSNINKVSQQQNPGGVFLAITSDKVQRAMHHGLVEIYRLNSLKQLFELAQSVPAMAPQQVQFAVLPISKELVLYVLSKQQARPLSIMLYKGVAGFKEIFAASTVPHGNKLSTLTTQYEHFVFIGDHNYTTVLRARFEDLHG